MTRKALARRIAEVLFNEPATLTQHFVLGYFRQVPAGLIFSNDLCNPDCDLLG